VDTEELEALNLLHFSPIVVNYMILVSVDQELEAQGTFSNAEVVVAGLCNIYTHYITTYEEYQVRENKRF
jgi:hypothetical protein